MIDEKLILMVGDRHVHSSVHVDLSRSEITTVWITTQVDGHVDRNPVTVKHGPTFDSAAFEKLIEQERWRHAGRLAGRAEVRSKVPRLILKTDGNARVVSK